VIRRAPSCIAGTTRRLSNACTRRLETTLALSLAIAACGGGGGSGDGGGGGGGGGGGTSCTSSPIPVATATISGQVGFERVPFGTHPSQGLDYAAIRTEPAREVLVEVLSAANQGLIGVLHGRGVDHAQPDGRLGLAVVRWQHLLRHAGLGTGAR
jgi:hypothetical protein